MKSISRQLTVAMMVILLLFGGIVVVTLVIEMGGYRNDTETIIEQTANSIMNAVEEDNLTDIEKERIEEVRKDPVAYAKKRQAEIDDADNPATYGSDMLLVSIMLSKSSLEFHHKIIWYIVISFLIAIVVSNVCIHLLARRIAKPILELTEQAAIIGSGNLDHTIEVKSKNEIGKLANSFQMMTDELKDYMNRMQRETADREHANAGREAARQVLESVRPAEFYKRDDFELYAKSITIEESGGDFYDCFMIDKTHLAIVLGDVKGTGLPAALVCVLACTNIKNFTKIGYSPARVMAETNNGICAMSGLDMTVAAFIGVIDLTSGELSCASAGMEAPLWKHAGDEFIFMEVGDSFRLGSMENVTFKQEDIRLTQGDVLAFYTEGISRAKNDKELEYSREFLAESLTNSVTKHIHSEQIVNDVVDSVKAFMGENEPDDDGSLAVFRYFGNAG